MDEGAQPAQATRLHDSTTMNTSGASHLLSHILAQATQRAGTVGTVVIAGGYMGKVTGTLEAKSDMASYPRFPAVHSLDQSSGAIS